MHTRFFVPTSNISFKNSCVWLLLLTLFIEQAAWAAPEPRSASAVLIPKELGLSQKQIKGPGEELIINIQDAHAKLGAQESIAGILDQLVKNYDLKLVALEGAVGSVDTSLMSLFPDENVRRKSGEKLLREGRISAGEFYSITSGGAVHLYGVEEQGLYDRNVQAFGKLVEAAPKVREEMKHLRAAISSLESKVYSRDLAQALQNHLPRGKADASFEVYWKFAREAVTRYHIDLKAYPHLLELERLFSLERKIDFKQVERERQNILSELSRVLPKNKLSQLFLHSLDFKRGRISASEYHQELLDQAKAAQISTPVRSLPIYTEYVTAFDVLDLSGVLKETEILENVVIARAINTPDEKTLVELRLSFETISRCLATALTGSEYGALEANAGRLDLERSLLDLRRLALSHDIEVPGDEKLSAVHSTLPTAKLFYQMASARDRVLLDNTLRRMRKDGVKIAALVSGGFHSQGISKKVEGENISCLIVMPKFDEDRGDRPYVTILTKKPKEFEEMFKDSDTFIVAEPLFSLRSAADGPRNFEALEAEFLAGARVSLGNKFPRKARLYLRSLARVRKMPGALKTVSLKTIGFIIHGASKGQNLRREHGGVTVEFPDGHTYLAQITRDRVHAPASKPNVRSSPPLNTGARLASTSPTPLSTAPVSAPAQSPVRRSLSREDLVRIIQSEATDPLILQYALAVIRDRSSSMPQDDPLAALDEAHPTLARKFINTFSPSTMERGVLVVSNISGVQEALKNTVRLHPDIPRMIESRLRDQGARLSKPGKDMWVWKIVGLITVATGLSFISPWAGFVIFGCGVFDILEEAPPVADGESAPIIPAESRENFEKQIRLTEQRGNQAIGAGVYFVYPEKAFGALAMEGPDVPIPTALVGAQTREHRTGPLLAKILNRRLFSSTKRFKKNLDRLVERALSAGYEPTEVVALDGHTRLATGGGNSIDATHPAIHLSPRRVNRWEFQNGSLVRVQRLFANILRHNGDFNGAYIFGRVHKTKWEIRDWLDQVLHRRYGKSTSKLLRLSQSWGRRIIENSLEFLRALGYRVKGDTPGIAGMMDLLTTQGMWYPSLRLSYQLVVTQSVKDPVPTVEAISRWTGIVESEFVRHYQKLYPAGSKDLMDVNAREALVFIKSVSRQLSSDPMLGSLPEDQRRRFVETAFAVFVANDPEAALRSFMLMTYNRSGSTYGLSVRSTLEPWKRFYASHGQPFYIGHDPVKNQFRGASEFSAVRDTLEAEHSEVLRLDQHSGEVATVDLRNKTTVVYSIPERRELTEAELRRSTPKRWLPLDNPYFETEEAPSPITTVGRDDRVQRDIELLPQRLGIIRDRARAQAAFDPDDRATYNSVSFGEFAKELEKKALEFDELQTRLQAAGIREPMQKATLEYLFIGIEHSYEAAAAGSSFIEKVFPALRGRTMAVHANDYLLDPDKYPVGPNTVVVAFSRSGQTFSSYHSTIHLQTLREKYRDHYTDPSNTAAKQPTADEIFGATQNYLKTLKDEHSVRRVFIFTRDLGSEMAAAIGQSFDPKDPFDGNIIIDGGHYSTAEPATQSVTATHETLNQLIWYTARKMRARFGESTSPLGLLLSGHDLNVIDQVEDRMINHDLPQSMGRDTKGAVIESDTHKKIVKSGDQLGQHIQEGGLATIFMKTYVFFSVITKSALFGVLVSKSLSQALGADVTSWVVFSNTILLPLDAVFYTWGGEILMYSYRVVTGRQRLARFYGQRTVKILSRNLYKFLDVYFGKLFAEAPGYFSVFHRSANTVREAMQEEAYNETRGVLNFITVPDGRLKDSPKIAREEDGTLMTAQQVMASGNVLKETPEIILMTFNARQAEGRDFADVISLPSDAPAILERERPDHPELVADLVNERIQSIQMLASSYLYFWAAANKVSTITLFGREFRLWDPAKTQDQAQIHTTAAPISPIENVDAIHAASDGDWVEQSMVGIQIFQRHLNSTPRISSALDTSKTISSLRTQQMPQILIGEGEEPGVFYAVSSDSTRMKFQLSDGQQRAKLRIVIPIDDKRPKILYAGDLTVIRDSISGHLLIRFEQGGGIVDLSMSDQKPVQEFALPLSDVTAKTSRGARLASDDDDDPNKYIRADGIPVFRVGRYEPETSEELPIPVTASPVVKKSSPWKTALIGTVLALTLFGSIFYDKIPQMSLPNFDSTGSSVTQIFKDRMPSFAKGVDSHAVETAAPTAVPTPAPTPITIAPSPAPVELEKPAPIEKYVVIKNKLVDRADNFRKMTINFNRAANEKDPNVAAYYLRAANRRAAVELESPFIIGARSLAERHLENLSVEASAPNILPTPSEATVVSITPTEATLIPIPANAPEAIAPIIPDAPVQPQTPITPTTITPPSNPQAGTLLDPVLGKPVEGTVGAYVDFTGAKPVASFSTINLSARFKSGVGLGVTFEGNHLVPSNLKTSGTEDAKLLGDWGMSFSNTGSFRVGVRKTLGNGRNPASVGVSTSFRPFSGLLISPEVWGSTSGSGTERVRALFAATPITIGPISLTTSYFKAPGASSDWQFTGSFDRGANHIFAAQNFTDPSIWQLTHVTPDTGKYRVGYGRDFGLGRISAYGFSDPSLGKGVGLIFTVNKTTTIGGSTAAKTEAPQPTTPTPTTTPGNIQSIFRDYQAALLREITTLKTTDPKKAEALSGNGIYTYVNDDGQLVYINLSEGDLSQIIVNGNGEFVLPRIPDATVKPGLLGLTPLKNYLSIISPKLETSQPLSPTPIAAAAAPLLLFGVAGKKRAANTPIEEKLLSAIPERSTILEGGDLDRLAMAIHARAGKTDQKELAILRSFLGKAMAKKQALLSQLLASGRTLGNSLTNYRQTVALSDPKASDAALKKLRSDVASYQYKLQLLQTADQADRAMLRPFADLNGDLKPVMSKFGFVETEISHMEILLNSESPAGSSVHTEKRSITLGILLSPGDSRASAERSLSASLGNAANRLDLIFGEATQGSAEQLIAQGSEFIIASDALGSGDTKLVLLQALVSLDENSLGILKPFLGRLLSGETKGFSESEERAIVKLIAQSFPSPAPRKILLTSQGLVTTPELVMVAENNAANMESSAGNVAVFLDKVLSGALTAQTRTQETESVNNLKKAAQATAVYLSDLGEGLLSTKLDLLAKQLSSTAMNRSRFAVADPSYKIDLSSIKTQIGRAPKTIFTDLEVFVRDAHGVPFVQRMKHLDRQSQGLFRHVLLVRDPQFQNKQQLLNTYPAAVEFGNNIIFAPGLANAEELISYRDQLSIERNFVVLAPKPGVIAIPRFESPYVDQALVVALDSKAESSVGILEQSALWLLFENRLFREIIYLPPVAGVAYDELVRIAKMLRSSEEAA